MPLGQGLFEARLGVGNRRLGRMSGLLQRRGSTPQLSYCLVVRTLRLLNFIAYDFSDSSKAALEKLGEDGRLAAYVDDFKSIVLNSGGYIIAKCAFQMLSKSHEVAIRLDYIARQLRDEQSEYRQEMAIEMGK